MIHYLAPLLAFEAPRLVEKRIADGKLADVVKRGGALDPAAMRRRQPHLRTDSFRIAGHTVAMPTCEWALGVDDLAEGGGNIVKIVLIDGNLMLARLKLNNALC